MFLSVCGFFLFIEFIVYIEEDETRQDEKRKTNYGDHNADTSRYARSVKLSVILSPVKCRTYMAKNANYRYTFIPVLK